MLSKHSSKRRRVDAADGPTRIADLPIEALSIVGSFLAAPSRALFAVSFGNDLTGENRSKIAGTEWRNLDFGEIEKNLAAKLSDNHIDAILRCINAVNKVQKLKLTNCINISGAGLASLRGSEVIEKIDLSLNGDHESAEISPVPAISCDIVVPILDSIIEDEGSSLMHIQFPKHWHERSTDSAFHQFLLRYKAVLEDPRYINCCMECDEEIEADAVNVDVHNFGYGVQMNICYSCFSQQRYCNDCEEEEMPFCFMCERVYCDGCSEINSCENCTETYCNSCIPNVECHNEMCDHGGEASFCKSCVIECMGCKRTYCGQCTSFINFEKQYCIRCWPGQ